nr:immunoglobulin light chain junction region [Macaca mulatta]
CGQGTKVPLTF